MLLLSAHFAAAVRAHAARTYPEECVGALLGTWDFAADIRTVTEVLPLINSHPQPRRAFALDTEGHLAFVRREREAGLAVVGFYHSHPDWPANPSEIDR